MTAALPPKVDSLKKRYFYKFITNSLGLVISLITQTIVPRTLGPAAYGSFNFLTNFFSQVASFLDFSSSEYMYNQLCKENDNFSLLCFSFYTGLFLSLALFVAVSLAYLMGFSFFLWPDQKPLFVCLAALFALSQWFLQRAIQMMDATASTVVLEKLRILQRLLGLFLVLVLFLRGALDLRNFFVQHIFTMIILTLTCLIYLRRTRFAHLTLRFLGFNDLKHLIANVYTYSHPLFLFSLVGMLANLLDRWLLQKYAGSVEQGFFGLSFQISAICFLFTSAFTPLLAREYSIAHHTKDHRSLVHVFRNYVPLFFVITAYFSCFLAVTADRVTLLFGGSQYQGAVSAVSLMAFYPIHQSYGQLVGSFFTATNRTKLYGKINVVMTILGVLLAFGLFAGGGKELGLTIGAEVLAGKMVFMQLVTVNIYLYYVCRLLSIPLAPMVAHQMKVILFFVAVAVMALWAVKSMALPSLVVFLLTSGVYTLVSVVCVLRFPYFFQTPPDLWKQFRRL